MYYQYLLQEILYIKWWVLIYWLHQSSFSLSLYIYIYKKSPYAPATFTPRNILVLIFRGWVNPGHMDLLDALEKIPGTFRLVAQRLNHYTTPGLFIAPEQT